MAQLADAMWKRILLGACLLVATFESPIGNSMDTFVLRYEVRYCQYPAALPYIRVVEQVVNGKTAQTVGSPRATDYQLPDKDGKAAPAPSPEEHSQ